ncbi:MAG: carboxypeptidase regulatory-like domain-containing protein [Planctomycetota bacterium]
MKDVIIVMWLAAAGLLAQSDAPEAPARTWPTTSIYGRILNVHHQGVPAARIHITGPQGRQLARTFADGEGFYQVRGLPAGPLTLHARADGLVRAKRLLADTGSVRQAIIILADAVPLQAVVQWPDGSPVAGADVLVFAGSPSEVERYEAETTTDQEGSFSLPDTPIRTRTLRIFQPGFRMLEHLLPANSTKPITITLPKKRIAQRNVEVRRKAGAEDASATVVCVNPGGFATDQLRLPRRARTTRVDKDGFARVWTLPLAHQLRVVADGMKSKPLAARCEAGCTRPQVFTLSPLPKAVAAPSTLVRGRVVDTRGQPLAGVVVAASRKSLRCPPTATDADGAFTLDVTARKFALCDFHLLTGDYFLGTPKAEFAPSGTWKLNAAADPDGMMQLDAVAAGKLAGTLRETGGQPFACARVDITLLDSEFRLRGRGIAERFITASDAAGRIAIESLPPGTYQLDARGPTGRRAAGKFEVTARQTVKPGPLTFAEGGSLRGVLTDADGKRIPSAVLWLQLHTPGCFFNATAAAEIYTDRNGAFSLPFLRADTYRDSTHSKNPQTFEITAGEETYVELEHPK